MKINTTFSAACKADLRRLLREPYITRKQPGASSNAKMKGHTELVGYTWHLPEDWDYTILDAHRCGFYVCQGEIDGRVFQNKRGRNYILLPCYKIPRTSWCVYVPDEWLILKDQTGGYEDQRVYE